MGKSLVLLVDDNRLPMEFYVKALEHQGYEVEQRFDPDTALEFAQKESSRIKAIILDIMMPPGRTYRGIDTNRGLKTGCLLYDRLRVICADAPIVILTNVREQETLKKFYELGVDVRQKRSCPPFELTELLGRAIHTPRGHGMNNQNNRGHDNGS